MQTIAKIASAVILLAGGSGMAFYEMIRIKAGKPILGGGMAVQLYWIAYLSLFVLGFTLALSAILH